MKRKQLAILFLCNLIIVHVGMGLFPILPLYATTFGATPAMIGLYLAAISIAITVGNMVPGWLTGLLSQRTIFIAAGILGIPALILIGQATALWQVIVLTAIVWFCGGVDLALATVYTALIADENHRGSSFSLMALAAPVGALIGGITVGQLVDLQGYPTMFAVLGVTWVVLPLVGLFALPDEQATLAAGAGETDAQKAHGAFQLSRTYYALVVVTLLAAAATNIGRLGTSLSMQALTYSASAVASTATVSGLIAIPVTLLAGSLSDRFGRRSFLVASYVLVAGGPLMLTAATNLWQFWGAATLTLVGMCAGGAVSTAFATDVLPKDTLSRGLPWLSATKHLAGVVTFASAGYTINLFGIGTTLFVAAGVAGIAALIISRVQPCAGAPGATYAPCEQPASRSWFARTTA